MRGARISFGLGLEGIQAKRHGLRNQVAGGIGESDQLPEPIFTPATKEETGHDINISFERMVEIVGRMWPMNCGGGVWIFTGAGRSWPGSAALLSPIPNSNGGVSTAN